MSHRINRDLKELVQDNVIAKSTAQRIRDYYAKKGRDTRDILFIILNILGLLLIIGGLVIIVTHYCTDFTRPVQTFFAILPAIVGTIFWGYSYFKTQGDKVWLEGSAAFWGIGIAGGVRLLSYIYGWPLSLAEQLVLSTALLLPVLYLTKSTIVTILFWIGATTYVAQTGYTLGLKEGNPLWYWGVIALVSPFCYYYYAKGTSEAVLVVLNWSIPVSLTIALPTFMESAGAFMIMSYVSFFSLLFIIGRFDYFKDWRMRSNGYLVVGSLGSVIMLLSLSYFWYWKHLHDQAFILQKLIHHPEFYCAIGLSLLATILLVDNYRNQSPLDIVFLEIVYLLFLVLFFIGWGSPVLAMVLVNILVFIIGFAEFYKGATEDHLGILNYGLLIISVLIVLRFFDIDFSYITRGIIFILIGAAFLLVNYWMLRERNEA